MEDRKLTEKESLEVITSMIALTKQRYIGDGRILLLFGYLTVAVSGTGYGFLFGLLEASLLR